MSGTRAGGTHIGEEVDVYTWFELNRLMPGAFLAGDSKGPTYNYPYFAINFQDDGKSKGR